MSTTTIIIICVIVAAFSVSVLCCIGVLLLAMSAINRGEQKHQSSALGMGPTEKYGELPNELARE